MRLFISLILLFCQSLVFSQQKIENITSLTLHKVYDEPDDSGCNSFIDRQNGRVAHITITNCDSLVLKLINLKSSLKKRKFITLCCQKGTIGCPSLEYMLTYQFNSLIDTLYFTNQEDYRKIFDYNNHKEYEDTENDFFAIVSKNKLLKEYYFADLDSLHNETFSYKNNDSVNVNNIKIRGTTLYGLKMEQIDKVIDTSFRYYKKEYTRNYSNGEWDLYNVEYQIHSDAFFFNQLDLIQKVILEEFLHLKNKEGDLEGRLQILGIKVGDDEKKLIEKFPLSTKYIQNQKKFFKGDDGNYVVSVDIENNLGSIDYILNNEKIIKIEVKFNYRE